MPASTVRTCCGSGSTRRRRRRVPHLGLEVSGKVIATGPQASRWRVGDQVCALTPGGGYAQYCLADERHCLPVPRGMDLLTAAAIPETTTRSGPMCSSAPGWRRASAFLVHGGSSGIGLTAIQLARARRGLDHGGNAEKAAACIEPARGALIYRDADYEDAIRQATGGRGVM